MRMSPLMSFVAVVAIVASMMAMPALGQDDAQAEPVDQTAGVVVELRQSAIVAVCNARDKLRGGAMILLQVESRARRHQTYRVNRSETRVGSRRFVPDQGVGIRPTG